MPLTRPCRKIDSVRRVLQWQERLRKSELDKISSKIPGTVRTARGRIGFRGGPSAKGSYVAHTTTSMKRQIASKDRTDCPKKVRDGPLMMGISSLRNWRFWRNLRRICNNGNLWRNGEGVSLPHWLIGNREARPKSPSKNRASPLRRMARRVRSNQKIFIILGPSGSGL